MLQSIGSQKIQHDLAAEQQQQKGEEKGGCFRKGVDRPREEKSPKTTGPYPALRTFAAVPSHMWVLCLAQGTVGFSYASSLTAQ